MPTSNPLPPQQAVRVDTRAQIVIALCVLAGLGYIGYRALRWSPSSESQLAAQLIKNQNVTAAASDAELFNDAFSVAYRADDGIGNYAIAAVYEYPALQRALDAYYLRSAHQEEVGQVLADQGANASTLAFYVIVDSVVPQTSLDLTQGVSLKDSDGRTYPFRSWQKLRTLPPQSANQVRTGSLLFFDRQSESGQTLDPNAKTTLQLTIKDLGGVPSRVFSWGTQTLPE